ncbi:hypothetical protein GF324_01015 [bacterium]|nr:hypothetical protein [bacterium]
MRWLILLGAYAAGVWAFRELSAWWKDSRGNRGTTENTENVRGEPKKSEPYDEDKVVDATYREVDKKKP